MSWHGYIMLFPFFTAPSLLLFMTSRQDRRLDSTVKVQYKLGLMKILLGLSSDNFWICYYASLIFIMHKDVHTSFWHRWNVYIHAQLYVGKEENNFITHDYCYLLAIHYIMLFTSWHSMLGYICEA